MRKARANPTSTATKRVQEAAVLTGAAIAGDAVAEGAEEAAGITVEAGAVAMAAMAAEGIKAAWL